MAAILFGAQCIHHIICIIIGLVNGLSPIRRH